MALRTGTRWGAVGMVVVGAVIGSVLLAPAGAHDKGKLKHLYKHLDKRYVRPGEVVIHQLGDWNVALGSPGTVDASFDVAILNSSTDEGVFFLHLFTPASILGRAYGLSALEVCYGVGPGDRIDITEVYQSTVPAPQNVVLSDMTDRTAVVPGQECYSLAPPSPVVPQGALSLILQLRSPAADVTAYIRNVTTTWTAP